MKSRWRDQPFSRIANPVGVFTQCWGKCPGRMAVNEDSTDEATPFFKFQGRKNPESLPDFRHLLPVIRSLKRMPRRSRRLV
ncbi:MAG: hypothetical protein MPW16_22100 (plasmid) [Candidatus Manganitrophus sp.]|nr:MAG: hypothetical protein MPW16_22100 [Candidatus Manganitrophus sp.]